jgi:hypothetical protein
VREIAPFLKGKKADPVVVILGQDGRRAVSLLSGHPGGGNDPAMEAAGATGGPAVVDTATGLAGTPLREVVAGDLGLGIPGFGPLAAASRELAGGRTAPLYDPGGLLAEAIALWPPFPPIPPGTAFGGKATQGPPIYAGLKVGGITPCKQALI